MFGTTIEFDMALEKDPDVIRHWVYKPSNTQRVNDKDGALFFVTEKGKQDIQLTIRVKEENTTFAIGERSEFSRQDVENAARHIAGGIASRVAADTPTPDKAN